MRELHKKNREFVDTVGDMINRCACKFYQCSCNRTLSELALGDLNNFADRVAIRGMEPMNNKK